MKGRSPSPIPREIAKDVKQCRLPANSQQPASFHNAFLVLQPLLYNTDIAQPDGHSLGDNTREAGANSTVTGPPWHPNPFQNSTRPPFVLGINGQSSYCPRLQVSREDPLSHFLGVGLLPLEQVCLRLCQIKPFPTQRTQDFWRFFLFLQRRGLEMGSKNISLIDTRISKRLELKAFAGSCGHCSLWSVRALYFQHAVTRVSASIWSTLTTSVLSLVWIFFQTLRI